MKLVLVNLIIIMATPSVFAQAASPKAFEKLNKMYDAAATTRNLDQVLAEIAKVKGCAGSTAESPDQIANFPWLAKAQYTSPSFGPGFPSETLTGIAQVEEAVTRSDVDADFFAGYTSQIGAQGLEIAGSTFFYTENECDYDANDNYKCHNYHRSKKVNLNIKISANAIHYIQGSSVAYCWKQ